MRSAMILAVGVIALLAMEVAYSFEIRRYDTPSSIRAGRGEPFLCGPITATLRAILLPHADSAPATPRNI